MAISRAELEAMDHDELIEYILELDRRLDDLAAVIEEEQDERKAAAKDRAKIRQERSDETDDVLAEVADVRDDLRQTERRMNHQRAKLTRRVANLEDELDFEHQDVVALASGTSDDIRESKLARLLEGGPETIDDDATATLYRAEDLARNWIRWGHSKKTRDGDVVERSLATKRDDLLTRLADLRNEPKLSWRQVYRAMQKIAELGPENIHLVDRDDWGKTLIQEVGDRE